MEIGYSLTINDLQQQIHANLELKSETTENINNSSDIRNSINFVLSHYSQRELQKVLFNFFQPVFEIQNKNVVKGD